MANLDSWNACAEFLCSRFACDDAGSRHIRARLDAMPVMVWLGRAKDEADHDVVHVACPLLPAGASGPEASASAASSAPGASAASSAPGTSGAAASTVADAAALAVAIADFPLGALRLLGEHLHLHTSFRLRQLTEDVLEAAVKLLVAETKALVQETAAQAPQHPQQAQNPHQPQHPQQPQDPRRPHSGLESEA